MSTKAAVILAAGKGVRMMSELPKVLHTICGKELVRHVVDAVTAAGYERVVVVVSPTNHATVRGLLGTAVEYAVQADGRGTAHAALRAKERLYDVDTVAVLNGDVPLIHPDTIRSQWMRHQEQEACATILTASLDNPSVARVVRDSAGTITGVIEDQDADERTREITEVNVGSYCFNGPWLWRALETIAPADNGELYLPAVVAAAARQGRRLESIEVSDASEAVGVNDRVQLSEAEALLQDRIRLHWMTNGVTIPSPSSVYIDSDASIGRDTTVLPNTHIIGRTQVADRCVLGPNSIIDGARIGSGCRVGSSVVEGSELEARVNVGPFTHVRPGSHISEGAVLGNFAEVNRSRIGRNTKSVHFSYLGDAQIGENVNIGAGTVTANYDGVNKLPTHIGDGAFVGCDTMLVAPVTVAAGAQTAAGAVVTKDVPPGATAVGVPAKMMGKNQRSREGGDSS